MSRQTRKCGGVAILTHESLQVNKSKVIKLSNSTCEMQILYIENLNLHIINIYRPPDTTSEKFKECIDEAERYLKNVKMTDNIMLIGDYNFPFLRWREVNDSVIHDVISGGTCDEQAQAQALLNIADKHFLNQVITEPTRLKNTMDLVFLNDTNLLGNIKVEEVSNHISDHNLIIADINSNIPNPTVEQRNENSSKLSNFNYWSEKADWEGMNNYFKNIPWHE